MHRQIAGKLTGPVTKWIVFVAVLLLTGVLGSLGGKLADVKNNEQSSWVPSSAESTRVADQLSGEINPNDIPTLVAYHRAGGLTEDDLAAIDEQAAEIAEIDGVTDEGVLTPNGAAALQAQGQNVPTLLSEDGEVAYLYFTFNMGKDGWNKIKEPVEEIKDITAMDGVDVYVGGFGGQAYDFISSFDGSHVTLLLMTFGVVILILLFTYRSPVLWILPILCAAVANTMAGGVVYLLAKYAGLVVNDQSQYILSILVIGAGTDYALLLVARYREELRRHEDRHEAMAFALHRAAPAIIASAATVVVGLMCLSFADLNSTASLGPVLAVGVAVTLLVMVTLLPALLVIFGRWIFWPVRPAFGSSEPTQTGLWARVGDRIKVRPRQVWVGTAVVLAVACLGLFKLDANGLSTEDSFTETLDSVTAQKLLADHDLADNSNTIQVVTNDDQLRRGPGGRRRHRRPRARPPTPPPSATAAATSRSRSSTTWPPRRPSTSSSRRATRCTPSTARTPWSAAGRRSTSTPRSPRSATTRWSSRWCCWSSCVILVLLLRALTAPLILIGTVILSFGAALGLSSLVFHYVFDFAGRGSRVPVVRVRVPGRAGGGLQHLPDDPGPGGDGPARHPQGIADRAVLDRRCDHVGRAGPRGDVPGAGHAAVRVPGRARASPWRWACCSTR